MELKRITEFAFKGLHSLFAPPGLPLVEKSEGVAPTTSLLVRGAAGTGKSTVALSLAHGIARMSEGIVLYLVTEASLADVEFKASVLKLPHPVQEFRPEALYEPGSVAVKHLILETPESVSDSPEALQKRAVLTAYQLIESRSGQSSPPIRAVVIDGFGVGESAVDRPSRTELIAFMQAVEDRGVSPVLVEETGTVPSDILTFAVDVCFTLAFERDEDTGRLIRRLVVAKSRYSDSTPGPHDAVLDDDDVPAVWPNVARLDLGPKRTAVGFFMPFVLPRPPGGVFGSGRCRRPDCLHPPCSADCLLLR